MNTKEENAIWMNLIPSLGSKRVMDPLSTAGIQLKQSFEKYFTKKSGEFIRNASVRILTGQGEMFRDTVVVVEGIRGGEKKWEFLLPDGFFHAKAFDEIDGHIKRLKEEFAPRVARSAARYNTRQLHGPAAIRSVAKPKRWKSPTARRAERKAYMDRFCNRASEDVKRLNEIIDSAVIKFD